MGRQDTDGTSISRAQVEAYLRRTGYTDAQVLNLRPLGNDTDGGVKSFGYGRPLRATFTSGGQERDLVFRTMSPDPFGHNRRSARIETLVLQFDTFNDIPRHIQAIDVGTFTEDGTMLPMGRGEAFLVTDYVDGALYADDLVALGDAEEASDRDLERARALATFLAELHAVKRGPEFYPRALRDTIGSGEGVFGLCDSYPPDLKVIPPERLNALEISLIRWRWKLRGATHRASRTHGDFHPFNILFRDGADFSVLDCSRGAVGEPADDLTCLSINYLFFALTSVAEFRGPLRQLWDTFWQVYLDASADHEVLGVVPPFFTWRALVLASPLWYPNVDDQVRDRLLTLCERLLAGEEFLPNEVDRLLR